MDKDEIIDTSKNLSSVENHLESESESVPPSPDHLKSLTLPMKLEVKTSEWDELDELLQVFYVNFFKF